MPTTNPVTLTNALMNVNQFVTVTVQYSGPVDQTPTVTVSNTTALSVGAVTNNGGNSYSVQVSGLANGTGTVTFTTTGGTLPVVTTSGTITVGPIASSLTVVGPGVLAQGATGTYTVIANGSIDPGSLTVNTAGGTALILFLGPASAPNTWTFTATGNTPGDTVVTIGATTNGTALSGSTTINVIVPITGIVTIN